MELLSEYMAAHPEMELIETYSDIGHSGANFFRPAFQKMMEDMQAGKFNCIVVRDFSRFGRNYVECGYYLQDVFPSYGIRFISIFDEYDSTISDPDELIFSTKNIVNEFYSRDLSKKVSAIHDQVTEQGVSCYRIPYGYLRAPSNKSVIILDRNVAPFLYFAFAMAGRGIRKSAIDGFLDFLHAPTPLDYLQSQNGKISEQASTWSIVHIAAWLHNRMYTGDLVTGKTRYRKIDPVNYGKMPAEKWKIVPGTHPAYVSHEFFDQIQEQMAAHDEMIKTARRQSKLTTDNHVDPVKGILYCSFCHKKLLASKDPENSLVTEYSCKGHFHRQIVGHMRYSISRSYLLDEVKSALVTEQAHAFAIKKQLGDGNADEIAASLSSGFRMKLSSLQTAFHENQEQIIKLKQDFESGIVDDDIYQIESERLTKAGNSLETEIIMVTHELDEFPSCFQAAAEILDNLTHVDLSGTLRSQDIHLLAAQIQVSPEQKVSVVLNHAAQLKKLEDYMSISLEMKEGK